MSYVMKKLQVDEDSIERRFKDLRAKASECFVEGRRGRG